MDTGGSLLRKTDDYLLLDTSYLITLTDKNLDNMQQINQTLLLERKLETSLSFDHYSSVMGREMMILNSRIQSLERVLCQQMKSLGLIEDGVSELYQNAQLYSDKPGYVRIRKGDRHVYSKCLELHSYSVNWDRSFLENGQRKCSHELPINFENQMKF